jgi:hypothetical protein
VDVDYVDADDLERGIKNVSGGEWRTCMWRGDRWCMVIGGLDTREVTWR